MKKEQNSSNYNYCNIKGCFECPFRYSDYDDFAIGDDTIEVCTLAQHLRLKQYFIDSYDTKANQSYKKLKTPIWCPVKEKPLLLKFDCSKPKTTK